MMKCTELMYSVTSRFRGYYEAWLDNGYEVHIVKSRAGRLPWSYEVYVYDCYGIELISRGSMLPEEADEFLQEIQAYEKVEVKTQKFTKKRSASIAGLA